MESKTSKACDSFVSQKKSSGCSTCGWDKISHAKEGATDTGETKTSAAARSLALLQRAVSPLRSFVGGISANKTLVPATIPNLHEAIRKNNLAEVTRMLDALSQTANFDVNTKETPDKCSLLSTSVKNHCDVALVTLLISSKADLNLADHFGVTPVHSAVVTGRDDLVQLLLSHGGAESIATPDKAGATALSRVVLQPYRKQVTQETILQSLLRLGEDSAIQGALPAARESAVKTNQWKVVALFDTWTREHGGTPPELPAHLTSPRKSLGASPPILPMLASANLGNPPVSPTAASIAAAERSKSTPRYWLRTVSSPLAAERESKDKDEKPEPQSKSANKDRDRMIKLKLRHGGEEPEGEDSRTEDLSIAAPSASSSSSSSSEKRRGSWSTVSSVSTSSGHKDSLEGLPLPERGGRSRQVSASRGGVVVEPELILPVDGICSECTGQNGPIVGSCSSCLVFICAACDQELHGADAQFSWHIRQYTAGAASHRASESVAEGLPVPEAAPLPEKPSSHLSPIVVTKASLKAKPKLPKKPMFLPKQTSSQIAPWLEQGVPPAHPQHSSEEDGDKKQNPWEQPNSPASPRSPVSPSPSNPSPPPPPPPLSLSAAPVTSIPATPPSPASGPPSGPSSPRRRSGLVTSKQTASRQVGAGSKNARVGLAGAATTPTNASAAVPSTSTGTGGSTGGSIAAERAYVRLLARLNSTDPRNLGRNPSMFTLENLREARQAIVELIDLANQTHHVCTELKTILAESNQSTVCQTRCETLRSNLTATANALVSKSEGGKVEEKALLGRDDCVVKAAIEFTNLREEIMSLRKALSDFITTRDNAIRAEGENKEKAAFMGVLKGESPAAEEDDSEGTRDSPSTGATTLAAPRNLLRQGTNTDIKTDRDKAKSVVSTERKHHKPSKKEKDANKDSIRQKERESDIFGLKLTAGENWPAQVEVILMFCAEFERFANKAPNLRDTDFDTSTILSNPSLLHTSLSTSPVEDVCPHLIADWMQLRAITNMVVDLEEKSTLALQASASNLSRNIFALTANSFSNPPIASTGYHDDEQPLVQVAESHSKASKSYSVFHEIALAFARRLGSYMRLLTGLSDTLTEILHSPALNNIIQRALSLYELATRLCDIEIIKCRDYLPHTQCVQFMQQVETNQRSIRDCMRQIFELKAKLQYDDSASESGVTVDSLSHKLRELQLVNVSPLSKLAAGVRTEWMGDIRAPLLRLIVALVSTDFGEKRKPRKWTDYSDIKELSIGRETSEFVRCYSVRLGDKPLFVKRFALIQDRARDALARICFTQAIHGLTYRDIVPLLAVAVLDDGESVACEYPLYEDSLERWMKPFAGSKSKRNLSDVNQIVKSLCATLAHCHDNSVAHRNIKSANILLVDGISPLLSDFDCSVVLVPSLRGGPVKVGWPLPADNAPPRTEGVNHRYLAPEAAGLIPKNASPQAEFALDVWALGCVIWQLYNSLHSEAGLDADFAAVQTDLAHRNDSKRNKFVCNVPQVVEFINQMLEPDPTKRPTANECMELSKKNLSAVLPTQNQPLMMMDRDASLLFEFNEQIGSLRHMQRSQWLETLRQVHYQGILTNMYEIVAVKNQWSDYVYRLFVPPSTEDSLDDKREAALTNQLIAIVVNLLVAPLFLGDDNTPGGPGAAGSVASSSSAEAAPVVSPRLEAGHKQQEEAWFQKCWSMVGDLKRMFTWTDTTVRLIHQIFVSALTLVIKKYPSYLASDHIAWWRLCGLFRGIEMFTLFTPITNNPMHRIGFHCEASKNGDIEWIDAPLLQQAIVLLSMKQPLDPSMAPSPAIKEIDNRFAQWSQFFDLVLNKIGLPLIESLEERKDAVTRKLISNLLAIYSVFAIRRRPTPDNVAGIVPFTFASWTPIALS